MHHNKWLEISDGQSKDQKIINTEKKKDGEKKEDVRSSKVFY